MPMYTCVMGHRSFWNVTSEVPGVGWGVLPRAIEPLEGIEEMMAGAPGGTTRLADSGRGPGRGSRALGVDLNQDWCLTVPRWAAAVGRDHTKGALRSGKAFVSPSHTRGASAVAVLRGGKLATPAV